MAADRTGVDPVVGGAHPGRGTHNALASLGSAYLELIAPDPDQPEPHGPRPFGLDGVTADGLVAFAVRPDEGDSIDAARRAGGRPAVRPWPRDRDEPPPARWGRAPLAQHPATGRRRRCRPVRDRLGVDGDAEHRRRAGLALVSFEIAHPDPASVAAELGALGLTVPVGAGPAPGLSATLRGPAGQVVLGPTVRLPG